MPYDNVASLPSNVKQLSPKAQRQWMHVWNSSYAACMRDEYGSAKKCESEAFARANGVVKGSELDEQDIYHEEQVRLFLEAKALFDKSKATVDDGWFPFLPAPGKYKHPAYGEVAITQAGNQSLVDSVRNRIYQAHIPIDAEHQTKLSGAVAWLTDMRLNSDGSADAYLEWTDRGRMLMEGGRFKYISPEFFGRWPDPATGVVHTNVVSGGAITTRPFFKDKVLRALVASEKGVEIVDGGSEYWFRDFAPEERDRLASSGAAMPDGSYPISTEQDLRNAVQAVGRAKDRSAAMVHIKKRAGALGKTDLLPEDWSEEYAMEKCPECGAEVAAGAKTCSCGAKLMSEDPTKDKGAPPQPVGLTEAQVEAQIKKATEAQAATFAEQMEGLKGELEAAKTLAASEKEAREKLSTALAERDKADRRREFTELVKGWAGDSTKNIAILEAMADNLGIESDPFKAYVEQQQIVAAELAKTVFREYGTSASGGAAGNPDAQLEAMAKTRAAERKIDFHQAYNEVMESDEGRALYERGHGVKLQ